MKRPTWDRYYLNIAREAYPKDLEAAYQRLLAEADLTLRQYLDD